MGWLAINATPQRYAFGDSIQQVQNGMERDVNQLVAAKRTVNAKLEQTQMLLAFHRVSSELGAEVHQAMKVQRNFIARCDGLIEDITQKIDEVNFLVRQYNIPRISREGYQSGRKIVDEVNNKGVEVTEIQSRSISGYLAAIDSRSFSALQAEIRVNSNPGT